MSDAARGVIERYYAASNAGDIEAFVARVTDDVVGRSRFQPSRLAGTPSL